MRRFAILLLLIFILPTDDAESASCPPGTRHFRGECFTPAFIQFLICVESTGAGKVSIAEGADNASSKSTVVKISAGGKGVVVEGHGGVEVERKIADDAANKRSTVWNATNMEVCRKAAMIRGSGSRPPTPPTPKDPPPPQPAPPPPPSPPTVQQFFDFGLHEPAPPPTITPPPLPLPPPCPSCPGPSLAAPVAIGVVSVAPLTFAVVEHITWVGKVGTFNGAGCGAALVGRGSPVCQQLYDDGHRARDLAITGYVTAGMLATTAVVVYYVERHQYTQRRVACGIGLGAVARADCMLVF